EKDGNNQVIVEHPDENLLSRSVSSRGEDFSLVSNRIEPFQIVVMDSIQRHRLALAPYWRHPPGGASPSLSCQSTSGFCWSESRMSAPCSRVSFAPRTSASAKSHSSKVERRRSASRKFARTNLTSLKKEARRSHPERSASVKSTSLKSFQQRVDSDRSVFLKERDAISDLPKNVRGRVRFSSSAFSNSVRKNLTPSSPSSSKRGRLA